MILLPSSAILLFACLRSGKEEQPQSTFSHPFRGGYCITSLVSEQGSWLGAFSLATWVLQVQGKKYSSSVVLGKEPQGL